MSYTLYIGQMGESLAADYLRRHGFDVEKRNFRRNQGEIDIIAKKKKKYHFIEVKSRSRREKNKHEYLMPEEAIDPKKIKKLIQTAKSYLMRKQIEPEESDWQIDVISVIIDWTKRKAKLKYYPRAVYEE